MAEPCPLVELHRTLQRKLRGIDSATLLTELGVPPNLQSLLDGLRRTRVCLERFPAELDVCLWRIPGERLDSAQLIDGIGMVLEWASAQSWPDDDLRCLSMERSVAAEDHPLYRYCVSTLLHWTDLYYVFEPPEAVANPADGLSAASFESLMAEFSSYVIAAQATIEPDDYLGFCRKWWGADRLPSIPLYPVKNLAGHVVGASRAVRRLSWPEHRSLLQFLLNPAHGEAFHERIFRAMEAPQFAYVLNGGAEPAETQVATDVGWSARDHAPQSDRQLLVQIALLLEQVRPGWTRPSTVRKRRNGGRRAGKRTRSQHRTFRDGYVRVPEQDVVRFDYVTDDGIAVEHLQPLPKEDPARAPDDDTDDGAEVGTDSSGSGGNSATTEAVDRATQAQRDGISWIPVGEQETDDDIDVVAIAPNSQDEPGAATNQWAKEHMRRHALALGLRKERLSLAQILHLLKAISRTAQRTPHPSLLALHASIALGRSIQEVEGFEIHAGHADSRVDPDRIHYFMGSRQWVFNSPVPAWADMPIQPIEHPRMRQLWLGDRTDFHSLVERCKLFAGAQTPPSCRPFQKLTQKAHVRLDAFLRRALPQADATLAKCAGFLFQELLAVTRGDLGIASLITGHEHSHSGSVRHYANYPAGPVWAAYFGAWLEDVEQYLTDGTAAAGANRAESERRYGAKRVPEAAAVRALISMLARRVGDASVTPAMRHNTYTAYTLVGMILGLGMRPVIEPLVTDTGGYADDKLLVSFIDKAKSDYDRRINPVPDVLAQHLQRYTAYRNALAPTLPTGLAHTKFIHLRYDRGGAGAFHPGDFDELVDGTFPLELYSLRRFVRTELASHYHVVAEDLDAYMGHWLFGVSPFDPLSTYPMQRLYDLAGGPLTELLHDMGFAALEPP